MHRRRSRAGLLIVLLGALPLGEAGGSLSPAAQAAEPVFTVLADFEDDSVAAVVTEVRNVSEGDVTLRREAIPARGQRSLGIEIGATQPGASVACDLVCRLTSRFAQLDRIAAVCWIKEGDCQVAFRLSDAAGQLWETPPQTVREVNRWVRVAVPIDPAKLVRVTQRRRTAGSGGDAFRVEGPAGATTAPSAGPALRWPVELRGCRVVLSRLGRQTIYLDDLEVEHQGEASQTVRGEFRFDNMTRIYEPGGRVSGQLVLENASRRRSARLTVEWSWAEPDGSVTRAQSTVISLPRSSEEFRSRQPVDFSRALEQPGLYRLRATIRGDDWPDSARFETTLAVSPSNRTVPRARARFFGVLTRLFREPPPDQARELDLAREIGVQLVALETPWSALEPRADSPHLADLDRLISAIVDRDMIPLLMLRDAPTWLPPDPPARLTRQAEFIAALAQRYGERLKLCQPLLDEPIETPAGRQAFEQLGHLVSQSQPGLTLVSPPLDVEALLRTDASAGGPASRPAADRPGDSAPGPPPERSIWMFRTRGSPRRAWSDLIELARRRGWQWGPGHLWLHESTPPAPGIDPQATDASEALSVLDFYTQAAAAGTGGVVWADLRDSDPAAGPERGLAARDFGPRASLLGYASAAGMLAGLRYHGPVIGAPDAYRSAMFVGSDRHVAVLVPAPHAIPPAVLAPIRGVPGEFLAFDLARRRLAIHDSAGPPLIPTHSDPVFVALSLANAQPQPQLGLGRPWLRLPGTVFAGQEPHEFQIELDAPRALRKSYLRLVLPEGAGLRSSLTARAIRASAGQTLTFPVALHFEPGTEPVACTLLVRVSLDDAGLDVPLDVQPLIALRPLPAGQGAPDESFRLGRLTPTERPADAEPLIVLGAYSPAGLHVRLESTARPPERLECRVGCEGAEEECAFRVEGLAGQVAVEALSGSEPPPQQNVRVAHARQDGRWTCDLIIPTGALPGGRLQPGVRLRLSLRAAARSADGVPLVWRWSSRPGVRRDDFRWLAAR